MAKQLEGARRRYLPPPTKNTKIEEDAAQHLWAISYCDLLMVLLTFFIIYFQTDDITVIPRSLQKLVKSLITQEQFGIPPAAIVNGTNTSTASPQLAKTDEKPQGVKGIPAALVTQLKGANLGVTVVTNKGDVVVDLPDNFYQIGQFKLGILQQRDLKHILDILQKFSSEISIVIIGHSDAKPIAKNTGRVIDSNLALSTLRGVQAVEYALSLGFDPRWLATEGVGEHGRNTRSLSLKLVPRIEK